MIVQSNERTNSGISARVGQSRSAYARQTLLGVIMKNNDPANRINDALNAGFSLILIVLNRDAIAIRIRNEGRIGVVVRLGNQRVIFVSHLRSRSDTEPHLLGY